MPEKTQFLHDATDLLGGVIRAAYRQDDEPREAAWMARPAGLEPATHSLEGCCSIHLS